MFKFKHNIFQLNLSSLKSAVIYCFSQMSFQSFFPTNNVHMSIHRPRFITIAHANGGYSFEELTISFYFDMLCQNQP